MRDSAWPWAQIAVAAILLALAVLGIVGVLLFDATELTFSFGGAIQAFFIFPGLVLSLVVNALVMRRHGDDGLSAAEKVLLVVEFALIAALIGLHFWNDGFGYAILIWPIAILLAVAIAIVAGVRNATLSTRRLTSTAS
jgi:hypothetical protein